MAEGWARHLQEKTIEPYSAGIVAHGLNPWAVRVMAEAGVDISGQKSKVLHEFKDISFDYVITVCDRARQSCPIFPGETRTAHFGFDDPPRLAREASSEEETLAIYRRVRDEILTLVKRLPEALNEISNQRNTGHLPQSPR